MTGIESVTAPGRIFRAVRSREPGYAVASLGDRCIGVVDYWGAPRRTVVVEMRAGDMSGTVPLTEADRDCLAASADDGIRAIFGSE